jgi:hypothetical protein
MHPMLDAAINKVVRLTITGSSWQLERVLASLTYRARLDIRHDLEEFREAHRFERARNCAYYLRRQGSRVVIWRWNYVASISEANRIRTLIQSLEGRLDAYRASHIFEEATHRSTSRPRLAGMAFHAFDIGAYPTLRAST